MASFNILALNGETGEIRDGISFPELLDNTLSKEFEIEGPPVVSRGIIVGAQYRPVEIEGRLILVPRKRDQVAWAGDTNPIMRPGNKGLMYAASGSVKTIQTEAGGHRHLIVAPTEGEQAVIVFVQTGLPGNSKKQEERLLEMLDKQERFWEHGAFALDVGARGLVRKIRTALTRSGGIITRVNQLIEVKPGGSILVAGMLNEQAIWRFANEGGRLRRVDAGENPRKKFLQLRRGERNQRDKEDEMPPAAAA